jgi:hypothetical protein
MSVSVMVVGSGRGNGSGTGAADAFVSAYRHEGEINPFPLLTYGTLSSDYYVK